MEKSDLESVFQTSFKEAKDNWKAKCPFHDERTASFFVHKTDGVACCFGCGVGGNIERIAATYLETTQEEARKKLNWTIHDKLERTYERPPPSKFPESWLAPFQKRIHKYVIKRGFDVSVLRSVETRWDSALKRQVFPHRNTDGELLGVVGRTCRGDDPKWLFYWEYDKGQALYDPFKYALAPLRSIFVVEGVFDLLYLQRLNVPAVSTLGTKVTKAQIRALRDLHTSELVLAYDNDDSGKAISEKIYQNTYRSKKVTFLCWPDNVKDFPEMKQKDAERIIKHRQTHLQQRLRRSSIQSTRADLYDVAREK